MVLYTLTALWTYTPAKSLPGLLQTLWKYLQSSKQSIRQKPAADLPLIIHSDRGSQYVSNAWREATEKMQRSYSHSGYPYDNACIESFHSLIKREWLNRFNIINYKHAYRLVFEYIETFYNTVRIHSHCDYMSPNDFEKCMRGYVLCQQQLSWQNFSFYFVLNLDTGPPLFTWNVLSLVVFLLISIIDLSYL